MRTSEPGSFASARLQQFMDAVRRQMPTFPEALPDLDAESVYARDLAADAPWAEETQREEMEGISIEARQARRARSHRDVARAYGPLSARSSSFATPASPADTGEKCLDSSTLRNVALPKAHG